MSKGRRHFTVGVSATDFALIEEARRAQRRLHDMDCFEERDINIAAICRQAIREHSKSVISFVEEVERNRQRR